MKTIKEMTEIMLAYDRGEQIERSFFDLEHWEDATPNFKWNWQVFDYRVKPKSKTKFIPFETTEEFLEAQKKHGQQIIKLNDLNNLKYYGYVNNIGDLVLVDNWNYCILTSFETLFNSYIFQDRTPCGKEIVNE